MRRTAHELSGMGHESPAVRGGTAGVAGRWLVVAAGRGALSGGGARSAAVVPDDAAGRLRADPSGPDAVAACTVVRRSATGYDCRALGGFRATAPFPGRLRCPETSEPPAAVHRR